MSMKMKCIFWGFIWCGVVIFLARSEPTEDKQALLDFMAKIKHSRRLNWDESLSACDTWIGITCDRDKSRIVALRLPGLSLRGNIPPETLSRLSGLQVLSLRSNRITGPFPSDFILLGSLTGLYLQDNEFQGLLPGDFSSWKRLSIVILSNNAFNGSIPSSLSNLTHLTTLSLANNSLSGEIPDLDVPSLQLLDLSNNNLTGVVPQSLRRFPASSFSGNHLVPGISPASPPPAFPPAPQPKSKSARLGQSAILGITIGGCAMLFLVSALVIIACYSGKEGVGELATSKPQKKKKKDKPVPVGRAASETQSEKNNRLVFFEGSNLAFDLEDLLSASAEVLGKGMFGTTYKAALEDASVVAVKRLKEVTAGRRDFEQHMELVGGIRQENVVPVRAYYYSKDEKLMVYDHYSQGSVSTMLHGKGENQAKLDWETRVRIATGAARGLAHIHIQNGGRLIHGNIKASNIFLNPEGYGCVSDIDLTMIVTPSVPAVIWSGGYRAPEVTENKKVSQASDVYSFGVVLLELLTGKSPIHNAKGNEVIHLVRWVHSVVREEWTAEVFDVELLRYPNIEEEMVELLQIAMTCAVRMPEQRPKMYDVVKMVEGIRRGNTTETRSESSTPPPPQIEGSSSVQY